MSAAVDLGNILDGYVLDPEAAALGRVGFHSVVHLTGSNTGRGAELCGVQKGKERILELKPRKTPTEPIRRPRNPAFHPEMQFFLQRMIS